MRYRCPVSIPGFTVAVSLDSNSLAAHIVVMKLGVSELDCIAVKNSVQYEGGSHPLQLRPV